MSSWAPPWDTQSAVLTCCASTDVGSRNPAYGTNLRLSQMRVGSLFSVVSLMPRIALRCEVRFGSADFSLCAFPLVQKSKSHRLKPVLLDRTGPALWLHVWNGPTAITKFLSQIRTREWSSARAIADAPRAATRSRSRGSLDISREGCG